MNWDESGAGPESQLGAFGIGRFIGAAFLTVWLAGWAVGEGFAIWILGWGAWSLMSGKPPGVGQAPVGFAVALAGGLFLFLWLVLWTLGGVAAGRELLRLLFGRDTFRTRHDCLEITRHYGLFRSVERLPREEIRRFFRRSTNAPLFVETTRGMREMTRLGTAAKRAELEERLNTEFGLQAPPAPVGALPKGWCELPTLERDAVVVKDPAIRRKQARTAWIICAVVSLVPMYLLLEERDRPDLLAALLVFVAIAGAVGWGAVWLSLGRNEWRLERGRLVLQRRFGQNRTPRFEAASIELVEDNSGENGPSYELTAVAAGAPERTQPGATRQHRRTIHSTSDDPTEPRNFGVWLSHRCQLPFADLTTAEAKAKELEALKQHLAASGRLGRAALRVIERLAPTPPGPGQ